MNGDRKTALLIAASRRIEDFLDYEPERLEVWQRGYQAHEAIVTSGACSSACCNLDSREATERAGEVGLSQVMREAYVCGIEAAHLVTEIREHEDRVLQRARATGSRIDPELKIPRRGQWLSRRQSLTRFIVALLQLNIRGMQATQIWEVVRKHRKGTPRTSVNQALSRLLGAGKVVREGRPGFSTYRARGPRDPFLGPAPRRKESSEEEGSFPKEGA